MRIFFGIALGAMLTVAVAFVADTWRAGPSTDSTASTAEHRTMVNWDVVGANLRIVRRQAHDVWTKLAQKVS